MQHYCCRYHSKFKIASFISFFVFEDGCLGIYLIIRYTHEESSLVLCLARSFTKITHADVCMTRGNWTDQQTQRNIAEDPPVNTLSTVGDFGPMSIERGGCV